MDVVETKENIHIFTNDIETPHHKKNIIRISPVVSANSLDPIPREYESRGTTPNAKEWRSCCFSINSAAAKYFVQASILTSLITYSAVMLVVNDDCNSQRNYSSLLMMCLGILIPSPKF